MDTTIVIRSLRGTEVEWEEKVSARTTRGAKTAATRWIKENLFEDEYSEVKKEEIGGRHYWTIK